MALLPILTHPNERLHIIAQPVEKIDARIPTLAQLETIAAELYPCELMYCPADTTNELWSVVGNANLWSSVPTIDGSAYYRGFGELFSDYGNKYRNRYGISAVCVK